MIIRQYTLFRIKTKHNLFGLRVTCTYTIIGTHAYILLNTFMLSMGKESKDKNKAKKITYTFFKAQAKELSMIILFILK